MYKSDGKRNTETEEHQNLVKHFRSLQALYTQSQISKEQQKYIMTKSNAEQ